MEGLLSALSQGGWTLALIGLCSLVSLAVALERMFSLRESRVVPKPLVDEVKRELSRGRATEALELCQKSWHPVSRVLEAGILRFRRPRNEIKEAIENAGRQEVEMLEKNLDLLAFLANIAPLLGLLGTVLGLIRIFGVLEGIKNIGEPGVLAGGVAEALINTAAGLAVAIPAMLFHHQLARRAQRFMLRMEKVAAEVLEILTRIGAAEQEYRTPIEELTELREY